MKVTMRTIGSIQNAINSLYFILNNAADDESLKEQCQCMIDTLFIKFPGVMPQPQRNKDSLAK